MIRRPPRSTLFPLHDALPICLLPPWRPNLKSALLSGTISTIERKKPWAVLWIYGRSEEHTSELQSHSDLVCRLLLEKKKTAHPTCRSVYHCHTQYMCST